MAQLVSQRLLKGHRTSKAGHRGKCFRSPSVSGWRASNVVMMDKAQLCGRGQPERKPQLHPSVTDQLRGHEQAVGTGPPFPHL